MSDFENWYGLEGLHEAQRLRYTADLLFHDIGKSSGLVSPDGRPRHLHGHYRITHGAVQMLVDGEWFSVPEETIQYRALEGDTGETRGGHWCGLMVFGNLTHCAILPPSFGTKARGSLKLRRSTVQNLH